MTITRDEATTSRDSELPRPSSLEEVPGWFWPLDQHLFAWFLGHRTPLNPPGDLLEMGCYLGKSTIVMGAFLRDGEKLTVCDLFGAEDGYTKEATKAFYQRSLTRRAFEANYLAFNDTLPDVVEGRTDVLASLIEEDSCRFVHIDASHMYDDVRGDILTAKKALREDGILVLDDYRTEHTPGVAAASWEAVFCHGLRPVMLSSNKLYGTWGDPAPLREALLTELRTIPKCVPGIQEIAGHDVIRASRGKIPAPDLVTSCHPRRVYSPARVLSSTAAGAPKSGSLARRIAVDLLPPVVTRALRKACRARG
ncbi:class I SAM-dependent methyltransferase [Streptomyces sporangiiformans]|uniref:Class I SAM-dependent methyltransferase n=1 Tax=Streptomyces sporangiiformans TaxID=2315329 RepID=A0A505D645_9ACTN|nr:class I SAM-dependent methyltransferase [Streptomyces sporangiiformans]TPQ18277.1 class I SAM-dependent methyltransferase [Streptomyces sporangiiformans]